MASTEPADLALNTALFMGAVDTGETEERIESVMRPQRYELGVLPPVTSQQHLGHSRFQIVVPDRLWHATQGDECQVVALIERLTALIPEHMMKRLTRRRETHHKQPQPDLLPVKPRRELTEIDLGLLPEPVGLRNGHHRCLRQLGLYLSNEAANRRLTDLGAMLTNQTLPHAVRRMTLLPGHLEIICQPANNDVFPRTQHRGFTLRCLAWRRHRIVDCLTHRTPMHTMRIR